jgi:hypothetical protein
MVVEGREAVLIASRLLDTRTSRTILPPLSRLILLLYRAQCGCFSRSLFAGSLPTMDSDLKCSDGQSHMQEQEEPQETRSVLVVRGGRFKQAYDVQSIAPLLKILN